MNNDDLFLAIQKKIDYVIADNQKGEQRIIDKLITHEKRIAKLETFATQAKTVIATILGGGSIWGFFKK